MCCVQSGTLLKRARGTEDRTVFLLLGDINDNALCSQPPQDAQGCFEIGCEYVALDPAQMAALNQGGSCELNFGPALAEPHRANGRAKRQRQLIWPAS